MTSSNVLLLRLLQRKRPFGRLEVALDITLASNTVVSCIFSYNCTDGSAAVVQPSGKMGLASGVADILRVHGFLLTQEQ